MHPESLERSLAEHPFIAGLDASQIAFLAGCVKNARFAAGEFLFREDTAADTLFLLRQGRVVLESQAPGRGATRVETLGPGDVLGWSALFEPYRWHLDGLALEPTLAFAIEGRCLREKMDREAAFGYAVARRLLQEVHRRLERVRLQQLDVYKGGS